jgi:thiol-disulfide isomerase/thioredoxin
MVVLELYGQGCGACTMFKSKYDNLAKQYPTINFLKTNCEQLLKKYNITALPSFVFILNNRQVKTIIGANQATVEKAIKELITLSDAPAPTKSSTSGLIKEITTIAELEALIAETLKLVVVDYHAERWCGPCKFYGPLFGELANEHNDQAIFVKFNTDQDQGQAFAKKHKITSFPTTLIFKDKKADQAVTMIAGADKAGVKKAILQATPAKDTIISPATTSALSHPVAPTAITTN